MKNGGSVCCLSNVQRKRKVDIVIEQEYNGMEVINGFSEPLTDWDYESEQP
jgi:hypothetical protein